MRAKARAPSPPYRRSAAGLRQETARAQRAHRRANGGARASTGARSARGLSRAGFRARVFARGVAACGTAALGARAARAHAGARARAPCPCPAGSRARSARRLKKHAPASSHVTRPGAPSHPPSLHKPELSQALSLPRPLGLLARFLLTARSPSRQNYGRRLCRGYGYAGQEGQQQGTGRETATGARGATVYAELVHGPPEIGYPTGRVSIPHRLATRGARP